MTQPALLTDIFQQASIRRSHVPAEALAPPEAPAGAVPAGALRNHERIPLDGLTLGLVGNVTLRVDSGSDELDGWVRMAADIEPSLRPLKSVDLEVGGTMTLDAALTGTLGGDLSAACRRNFPAFHKPILLGSVWFIPVYADVALDFNVGLEADGHAEGSIHAGLTSGTGMTAGATLRDRKVAPLRDPRKDVRPSGDHLGRGGPGGAEVFRGSRGPGGHLKPLWGLGHDWTLPAARGTDAKRAPQLRLLPLRRALARALR